MTTTAEDQATVQTASAFANAAYASGQSQLPPGNWTLLPGGLGIPDNPNTGYQARVFVNQDTQQLIFANAGTNDSKDVASWNTVLAGNMSPQMQDAILVGQRVNSLVITQDWSGSTPTPTPPSSKEINFTESAT